MNSFKTWGSAIGSLKAFISDTLKHEFEPAQRTLTIHRAYQSWCESNGIEPIPFRNELSKMYARGDLFQYGHAVCDLIRWIPTEFSVRGTWKPEPNLR